MRFQDMLAGTSFEPPSASLHREDAELLEALEDEIASAAEEGRQHAPELPALAALAARGPA